MPNHRIMDFDGRKYRYLRSKTKMYGYCLQGEDATEIGTIGISDKINGRMELDTNIHEMLHACDPDAGEQWVNKTARQIAKALWDLGYRKNETTKKRKKRSK